MNPYRLRQPTDPFRGAEIREEDFHGIQPRKRFIDAKDDCSGCFQRGNAAGHGLSEQIPGIHHTDDSDRVHRLFEVLLWDMNCVVFFGHVSKVG